MTTHQPNNQLLIGDCRESMQTLPAGSVHCVVTSPPYWGLRDYGLEPVLWADGESAVLGLEPTPEAFIRHIVEVFSRVRRVLRDDGVLFLNLGDSYCSIGGPGVAGKSGQCSGRAAAIKGVREKKGLRKKISSLKNGDLLNMPHRVAAALRADGWYWRSTIIWHKRSPMPESLGGWQWRRCRVAVGRRPVAVMEDCPGCKKCQANGGYVLRRGRWRPTTSHEYVFLMTKSERYFCDQMAVMEPSSVSTHYRGSKLSPPKQAENYDAGNGHRDFVQFTPDPVETRNPRSVWTLSNEPYKDAHFATFPTQLVKRCIESGTSATGCCPECGSQYAPVVESERVATRPAIDPKAWKHKSADELTQRNATSPNLDPARHVAVKRVTGRRPTCQCNAGDPVPSLVFDPFAGSGTTLQTARALGRDYMGCELSEEYAKLAEERIVKLPKWVKARVSKKPSPVAHGQQELF